MKHACAWVLQLALLLACAGGSHLAMAGAVDGGRCVAPAKPGGGFDLTCQLTRDLLQQVAASRTPPTIAYQPGGIGALAFKATVNQRPPDSKTVVAFSSGSLLNLAQNRFGPYSTQSVRWLAVLGMDYGVVAVQRDSPYKSLGQLMEALRRNPAGIVFGAGGSIGSQDWMKAALLARAAGVSHKVMRFVAFEGGGEALSALGDNHVQVLAGDAAEVGRQIEQGGAVRVLAVLSDKRLGGRLSGVPTAREQGFDIQWPILRGLYMGPGVPERDYKEWADALAKAASHPGMARALARAGMERGWIAGPALDHTIQQQVDSYRELASEFGLSPKAPPAPGKSLSNQ
nr:tripartite tricarboxylate transporter substrate-binding protein [uncultured Rhodoferax sp.]